MTDTPPPPEDSSDECAPRLSREDNRPAAFASRGSVETAVEQLIEEVAVPQTRPSALKGFDRLRGSVAIVTGASRGLGRAIALDLAATGVHIAFNFMDDGARSRTEAQKVAREIREREVRVFVRDCDVRDPEQVNRFVDQTREELGGLHILINNAGVGADRALWHMSDDEWQAVVRTNLDGCFHFLRAVAPTLREQEWGKIVSITSVHASRSEFGLVNYSASKAGVIALTRNAALELGPRNVNVNAVAPGYIRTTQLTERVPAELLDRARERSALERLGDPQDVSGVVLFLCSEAARHITGAVIPVDGGYQL